MQIPRKPHPVRSRLGISPESNMAAKTFNCFFCDQNPRVDGDIMCRSCKEEHPMCYECGQRRRNLPFKLCTKCYQSNQAQRQRPGSGLNIKRDDLDANLDGVVNSLDSIALTPGQSENECYKGWGQYLCVRPQNLLTPLSGP